VQRRQRLDRPPVAAALLLLILSFTNLMRDNK